MCAKINAVYNNERFVQIINEPDQLSNMSLALLFSIRQVFNNEP